METYTSEELHEILTQHKQWLNSEENGKRANLSSADLSYANLRGANLRGANLRDADLRGANLWDADLGDANLGYANLRGADLRDADLRGADLRGANLRGANLRDADLRGANLGYANLRDAYLRGADLRGADLWGTLGNLKHIKSLQCEKYYVTYTSSTLQIGCQKHTIEDWEAFDNEKIKGMDVGALEWWTKWKPIIMQIIEMSPAEPTGVKNE